MKKRNRVFNRIVSITIIMTITTLSLIPIPVQAENNSHIIINQFYGVGNASCSSHSFIELYNPTNQEIDLTGYSIHYVPTLAIVDVDGWSELTLSGSIPAKGSYLIRCNSIANADNPKIDLTSSDSYDIDWNSVTIYPTGGSMCLLSSDVELGDSYSNIDSREDYVDLLAAAGSKATDAEAPRAYENSYAKVMTKKKGVRRVSFADTNNNASDVEAVDYDASDISSYRPRSSHNGSWGDAKLILINEINTLKSQVPKYYRNYCSNTCVASMDEVLAAIPSELSTLSVEELTSIRDELSASISSLQYKSKNDVPSIYLTTNKGDGDSYGSALTKDIGYVSCRIAGAGTDGVTLFDDSEGKVKIRGNSTSKGAKKPYNIKFSEKRNLFGFGKAKSWCLLADYYDNTLLRNQLALDLAKELGLESTMDHQRVDVYMDGEYQGSYLLTEKIEADKNRIDIKTGEDDTDFMIEMDVSSRIESSNVYFTTSRNYLFRLREPDEDKEYAEAHAIAVKDYMDMFEDALTGDNWDAVSSIIDIDSFARYYVLNEYMRPPDFIGLSVYFYCKNGILYAGPAWDYDVSSGCNYIPGENSLTNRTRPIASQSHYFKYLLIYPEFREAVRAAFITNADKLQNIYEDNGWIDTQCATYAGTIGRNNDKWGIEQNNYEVYINNLKSWFSARYAWMDTYTQGDFKYVPLASSGGGDAAAPAPTDEEPVVAPPAVPVTSADASKDSKEASSDASGESSFASMDASKDPVASMDALDVSSDASGDPVVASENATSGDGASVEPSGDATISSSDATVVKLPNTLKLKVYKKVYKRTKDLKKKKAYAIRVINSKGAVKYALNNKAKKAGIAVSKKGIISIPKKCKKGIYSITVHASGNKKYLPGTKTFVLKVK